MIRVGKKAHLKIFSYQYYYRGSQTSQKFHSQGKSLQEKGQEQLHDPQDCVTMETKGEVRLLNKGLAQAA